MINKFIKRTLLRFGYGLDRECFKIMHANGGKYIQAIKSNGLNMPHMLLANHLFSAAVELLMHNNEGFNRENNQYIQYHHMGVIDPPTAAGLLMGYIVAHPEENEYSLFNLAIRCIKAAEIRISGQS